MKCPLQNRRFAHSLAETPKHLQGKWGDRESATGPHTLPHTPEGGRDATDVSAHLSAEPAAGLASNSCPTGKDPCTRKPREGRLGKGDREATEPQTKWPCTSRQQERRKWWPLGDQNVQIMGQILLLETPANKVVQEAPCHGPKLFTQVLKIHFKRN